MADEDIITELVEFGASKVSGVRNPANGTEWLLMKAAEEPPKADPENPHKTSPEADEQEGKMTKAEADEIEALLTKSGLWASFCGQFDCEVCAPKFEALGEVAEKAKLKASQRAALPKSAFAVPEKAPASGSYPINDESHARNALSRSAGKPVASQVRAAVHARYPNIGKKDSPGVPNGDAHPEEAGHLASGMSGLAGPMTGRTLDYDSTAEVMTDWPGGKVTYEIPVEAKANSIGPHGGPHMRKEQLDFEIPAAKANWKELGRGELPGQGDQVVGSPAWERADAATLDSVARGLAAAAEQVRTIQGREVKEAMAGDAGDWGDAMQLSCAADDICNALGVVAAMAYHEAAEGNVTKSATTERLFEIFGGRPFTPAVNGAETSEEGSPMPTATKEELDAYIGEEIQKGVAEQVKKIEKSSIKPLRKTIKALQKQLEEAATAAKENAIEAGAVTTGDLTSAVHGVHNSEDIDAIDGAHTDKPGVTKEVKVKGPKGTKALVKALQENNTLLSKQLARPRSGGPVTDGQPRTGMIPALEGRQFGETVAKDSEAGQAEVDVVRLRKEFAESANDPALHAAKGHELTLAQIKLGHLTGAVPIGQF